MIFLAITKAGEREDFYFIFLNHLHIQKYKNLSDILHKNTWSWRNLTHNNHHVLYSFIIIFIFTLSLWKITSVLNLLGLLALVKYIRSAPELQFTEVCTWLLTKSVRLGGKVTHSLFTKHCLFSSSLWADNIHFLNLVCQEW